MGPNFPIPVLAVAADAIRDLEGRDALSGLWTLFTKCKESLQDGRRLENISWRLWYREIMLTNLERERDLDNEKIGDLTLEETENDHEQQCDSVTEKAFYPIQPSTDPSTLPPAYSPFDAENGPLPQTTPLETLGSSPGLSSSPGPLASLSRTPSPLLSPSIPAHNRRPSTSRSRRSSFLNGPNGTPLNVGKIIFDMLPTSSSTNPGESNKAPVTALFIPRPALSHKSTSSTIVSGEEIDNKPEANLTLTKSASSIHDPMIPVSTYEPSLSPTLPASLTVVDGARSTKLSLPDISTVSFKGNGVSSLPTPEPQESDPRHNVIVVGNSSEVIHISSSIPSLSIPTDLIPIGDTNNTSISLSTIPDGLSKVDPQRNSDSLQAVQPTVYAGPPSPSLSDSYACAHPAEVGVKEVGLLPSLSVSHDLASGYTSSQLQHTAADMDDRRLNEIQTPPSSSSATTVQNPNQRPQPPTLVVVNPTPNPTPHPTPPATPLIHGSIGPGGLIKSQWLALPEGTTGSRQHQLLQAAQLHLGPQANTLRLPPAFIGIGNNSNSNSSMNVTAAAMTGPVNRELDRSRSLETALCAESHSQVSPENEDAAFVPPLEHPTSLSDSRSSEHKRSPSSSSCEESEVQQYQQHIKDNSPKRHSISSTTSSRRSQTSVSDSSVSGRAESTSTTNTSASEYDHSDTSVRVKTRTPSEQQAAAMFEVLPAGIAMALQHGPKRLNSLSTIQSMSTFTDRKKEHIHGNGNSNGLRSSDSDIDVATRINRDVVGATSIPSDEEIIMEHDEDEDNTVPLSPLPLPGDLTATSPRTDKRRKRNSAPTLPTSSHSLHVVSPTGSGSAVQGQHHHSQQVSSPKSATSTASGMHARHNNTTTKQRKQITAGNRSSSRSRSVGGSSLGKSRSRSREAGGVGLGGFGMTQVAPAPPPAAAAPSAMPVVARKAPMVAGGRGRAKVMLGRTGLKAKGLARRNSSGTTAVRSDHGKSELELEKERAEKEAERAEKEYQERMKIEAVGKGRARYLPEEVEAEEEQQRRIMEEQERRMMEEEERRIMEEEEHRRIMEEELIVLAIREREAEEAEAEMARRRAAAAAAAQQQQQQQRQPPPPPPLPPHHTGGFRLGSNSDQGSGVGSKSAGSSSGLSPARRKLKGKGKRREEAEQARRRPQQVQDHSPAQLPRVPEPTRQLSKPQLRQLQMMEQVFTQQLNQGNAKHPQPAHERQLTPSGQELPERQNAKGGERSSASRKGKEREAEVENRKSSKSSAVKAPANLLLAPNLEQHLAAPLLPQNRRKIVLATSESDFETDSDDDGSWSSEEMTGEEEDRVAQEEQLRQEQLHQQRVLQQQLQQQQLQQKLLQQQQIQQQRQRQQQHQQHQLQQHQQPTRPPGVQRTQSSQYPPPNNTRNGKQSSRAHQRNQHQVNAQAILDAAAEAQRQREMFVKLPTSSFQNLASARAKSVGLLTQLMNPNPEIFPPNHPYRRGFSSTEIKSSSGVALMRPLTSIAPSENKNGQTHPPIPEERAEKQEGQQDKKSTSSTPSSRTHFSPPSRPGGMNRTKSAAAIPVSSHFAIGSMLSKVLPVIDHNSALPAPPVVTSSASKIRLGPPPADAEMEDDSDDEGDPGGISKSVAHEKLKALARKERISANQHPPPIAGPSSKCVEVETAQVTTTETATAQATTSQATTSQTATAQATTSLTLIVQATTSQVVTSQATTSQAITSQATTSRTAAAAHANADDNVVPNWVVSQPQGVHQHRPQQSQQRQQQQQQQHHNHHQQQQQQQQQQHVRTRSNPQHRSTVQFADVPESSRARQPPAPIPVGYPYNLPISAVPSTPRTTRRQMLSTELPESLRRNLLWERQVSNGNLPAMRRSASGGGTRHNVLGGLRPLTVAPPPMVELRPRVQAPAQDPNGNRQQPNQAGPSNTNNVQTNQAGPSNTNNVQTNQTGPSNANNVQNAQAGQSNANNAEAKRLAMERNKSWANEYHVCGW